MRKCRAAAVLVCTAAAMMVGSPALADSPQDPGTPGQGNKDWGKVASNVAQLSTEGSTAPDGSDANGGAMGQHARATTAADNNGGFASSDNGFGITFNVKDADGNAGRDGVGNVTRDLHNSEPGDGGNGTHAVNNAELSGVLNPVTGEFTTNAGGTAEDVSGELLEGTSADPTP
ncbi:MAG TPA: hypothetical protein VE645_07450 [Pseudonocardiaceae bacterium]|nr:hypothetical protein [Pseudonocardiaceae bacterium]